MATHKGFITKLKATLKARSNPQEYMVLKSVAQPPEFADHRTWTTDHVRQLFLEFLEKAVGANPHMFHAKDIAELETRISGMSSTASYINPAKTADPWTCGNLPGYRRWKLNGNTWASALETMIQLVPRGCPIPPRFAIEYKGYAEAMRDLIAVPNGLRPMLIPVGQMQMSGPPKRKADDEAMPELDGRPEKLVKFEDGSEQLIDFENGLERNIKLEDGPEKRIKLEEEVEDSYDWPDQPEPAAPGHDLRVESEDFVGMTDLADPNSPKENSIHEWAAETKKTIREMMIHGINPDVEGQQDAQLRRNMTDTLEYVTEAVASMQQQSAAAVTTRGTGTSAEARSGSGSNGDLLYDDPAPIASKYPSLFDEASSTRMRTYSPAAHPDHDDLFAAHSDPRPKNLNAKLAHGKTESPKPVPAIIADARSANQRSSSTPLWAAAARNTSQQ
ncbi:hypothetical protein B0T11DRAFT_352382 [Plectosphaerella cucumerina]|uniref:Uncharacterized protein n=1 Tax=Plectosphaerella cucumerina TaxID=40658 RepID=A0A8K0X3T0_9PEZI|nr:hypothetical protein B0T11DRAFT_352382 [Plectosphaerella cucumerina]